MNKSTLKTITVFFLFSNLLFSQDKVIKKNSLLEISIQLKPINHSIFDVVGYSKIISQISNFHAEYKLAVGRKFSIGVLYNFEFFFAKGFLTEQSSNYYDRNLRKDIYKNEYYLSESNGYTSNIGFSLNFYTKGFIAPIGNSFSFYYKRNSARIPLVKYKYTLKDQNYSVVDEGESNKEVSLIGNTFGISFNGMKFLSDNTPIYISYSMGGGIMFGMEERIGTSIYNEDIKYNGIVSSYKDWIKFGEMLNFKVGIGFYL